MQSVLRLPSGSFVGADGDGAAYLASCLEGPPQCKAISTGSLKKRKGVRKILKICQHI